jgi:hypothetical protein
MLERASFSGFERQRTIRVYFCTFATCGRDATHADETAVYRPDPARPARQRLGLHLQASGARPNPDGGWTAQQARNLLMQLGDEQPFRLLIHDRDTKFGGGSDEVFRSEGSR